MVVAFLESKAKGPSFSLHLQIGLEAFFVYRFSLESKEEQNKKEVRSSPRKIQNKTKKTTFNYTRLMRKVKNYNDGRVYARRPTDETDGRISFYDSLHLLSFYYY